MDRRFPTIIRFADFRDVTWLQRSGVNEVERRTGTNAIIDTRTNRVVFRYGSNIHGPHAESLGLIRAWNGGDIDRAVSIIQSGKLSVKEKDRLVRQAEQSDERQRAEDQGRTLENANPHALDYVAFNDRKRRGVQKTTV